MKMTKEFLEEMELIVEFLFEGGLGDILNAVKFIDDECFKFQNHLRYNDVNFKLAWGCSKLAILTHMGYCIKTGLGLKSNWRKEDYCQTEWINYLRARDRHIECFFPETFYLGNIHGFDFYIQEEVQCDEDEVTSSWYNSVRNREYAREEFLAYEDYYSDFEDYVTNEVAEMEDDEKIRILMEKSGYCWQDIDELINFIDDYDINDLHEGNWGFRFDNKKCVIVDFSGF